MSDGPVPVPIDAGEPSSIPAENIRTQFTLPSGKKVIFLRGKGRDLRLALMAAGPGADQYRILFAIIAQLALIDGKKTTMEAIDMMDLDDVLDLQGEAGKVLLPLAKAKAIVAKSEEEPSFLQ